MDQSQKSTSHLGVNLTVNKDQVGYPYPGGQITVSETQGSQIDAELESIRYGLGQLDQGIDALVSRLYTVSRQREVPLQEQKPGDPGTRVPLAAELWAIDTRIRSASVLISEILDHLEL